MSHNSDNTSASEVAAAVVVDKRLDAEFERAFKTFAIKPGPFKEDCSQEVKTKLLVAIMLEAACGRIQSADDFWHQVDAARKGEQVASKICQRLNFWIRSEIRREIRKLPREKLCGAIVEGSRSQRMLMATGVPADPSEQCIHDEEIDRMFIEINDLSESHRLAALGVPTSRMYKNGQLDDDGVQAIALRSRNNPDAQTLKEYPVNATTKKQSQRARDKLRARLPDMIRRFGISLLLAMVIWSAFASFAAATVGNGGGPSLPAEKILERLSKRILKDPSSMPAPSTDQVIQ